MTLTRRHLTALKELRAGFRIRAHNAHWRPRTMDQLYAAGMIEEDADGYWHLTAEGADVLRPRRVCK